METKSMSFRFEKGCITWSFIEVYQIFSCWILIPNLSMTASGIQKTGLTLNNRSSWPNRLKPAMPNWKRRKRVQLIQLQFGSIDGLFRILAPNHFSETTFIIKLKKCLLGLISSVSSNSKIFISKNFFEKNNICSDFFSFENCMKIRQKSIHKISKKNKINNKNLKFE